MGRNVVTAELRTKYHMSPDTVKLLLKQNNIKPVKVEIVAGREYAEWPNRASNAVLREYRQQHPVGTKPGIISKLMPKKKDVSGPAPVTDIAIRRETKRYEDLSAELAALRLQVEEKNEVAALREQVQQLTALINTEIMPGLKTIVNQLV